MLPSSSPLFNVLLFFIGQTSGNLEIDECQEFSPLLWLDPFCAQLGPCGALELHQIAVKIEQWSSVEVHCSHPPPQGKGKVMFKVIIQLFPTVHQCMYTLVASLLLTNTYYAIQAREEMGLMPLSVS